MFMRFFIIEYLNQKLHKSENVDLLWFYLVISGLVFFIFNLSIFHILYSKQQGLASPSFVVVTERIGCIDCGHHGAAAALQEDLLAAVLRVRCHRPPAALGARGLQTDWPYCRGRRGKHSSYNRHNRHNRKLRTYQARLQRQGIAFFPLAVCAFGSWHKEAQDQIRKAAWALARHTGQFKSTAVSHLWTRLSVTLQKANCAALASRMEIQM